MAPVNQLEVILRYAYLHGFTSEQWVVPTKECLEAGDQETALCDLLLTSIFSFNRVSDPLLESYLTFATNTELVSAQILISHLIPFGESTASRHPYQWSFILKLLSTLLTSSFNADIIVSDLQKGQENAWVNILSDTFQMLSHIVAVGLYPKSYVNSPTMTQATLVSAISFHNSQPNFDSQFSFTSQASYNDPDSTLDMDNTQHIEDDRDTDMKDINTQPSSTEYHPSLILVENAALAAQIMMTLIEKKNAKRIFEVRNNQRRQAGMEVDHEPWVQCQSKLESQDAKCPVASQNPHIQKLVLLIQRLTDRDLERRMAVHMKYHELEDEGTARAMPSAGLMGLLYHMVQIRPSLDDDYIVDHLLKLQTIKGSFDESFYFELWMTALTGLREASLNTTCKGPPDDDGDVKENKSCNSVAATNRLLWKSLVLVKLPFLIGKFQKKKQENGDQEKQHDENEMNSLECSLKELQAFTGLVNACSPRPCCSEFYAPDSMSSTLVERIAFGEDGDDGDLMELMDDTDYETDLNTTTITKSIRSISNNDIFTNIVQVCERDGFVRPWAATELLKKKGDMEIEPEKTAARIIDQNIDQRFRSLKANVTFSGLTELLHIGLISPIHLRKIVDFVLVLLKEKAVNQDFYALSKICDALSECPCSVDLILQLYTPHELIGPLEGICNHWSPSDDNMSDVEEETSTNRGEDELEEVQLLYNKFGKIWNLTVSVVKRFKLYRDMNKVFADKEGFVYKFFTRGPMIYGVDIRDNAMEPFINRWMSALAGGDGLSDDLLRTSKPQDLLMIVPTIIQRCITLYSCNQMESDAFTGMISYFQKKFLDFTLSGIILIVCEELLSGKSAIALTCLRQLIMSDIALPREISLHPVLGSLESLLEFKRQESAFLTKEEEERNVELAKGMSELTQFIMTNNKMDKLTEDHSMLHTETVTTNVTPSTLFEKAELMFKYIVKSGRSMFMNDVDADPNTLWDTNDNSKQQVVSHYLDMSLFETVLEIGGGHWFISMIVDQVLEAGKSGGAVRAAELGSCLITTPLLYSVNTHNSCFNLLRCLLQDILPSLLDECARQNTSFFQGQTLGVFTSDCLVLMHDRIDSVKKLGKWFFSALVIDQQNNNKKKIKLEDDDQIVEGTRFAEWNDETTESAVWRGFVKGLMSNPVIEEVWPNAFI
ncbi:hypothetical protein HPULCUR_006917 [Helicostylum pulchrum]|uniref:Mediator of RNA polymerase II transcription subunit 5 n=1 Tax=Helicostylum pulchrum TaxID=562976 RepID=A0ABP9Y4I5_9FUNG